jgi:hypothetical protein
MSDLGLPGGAVAVKKKGYVYIWRLEVFRESGLGWFGVFMGGKAFMPAEARYRGDMDLDPYRHPIPQDEGLPCGEDWHCGFRNLKQYRLWFATAAMRRLLDERKVRLKRFKVHKRLVRYGETQVVFKRKYAYEVEQRSPSFAD